MPVDTENLIYSGELTQTALSKLVNDDLLAIIVPDFASPEYLKTARSEYAKKPMEEYQYFDQASGEYKNLGVKRFGLPYNTTYSDDKKALEKYYAQVPSSIWAMRQESSPLLHPIDRLRLMLDELWPQGAGIAAHNGAKNFVGMYREVRSADSAQIEAPHFDALPAHKGEIVQQFAANVYIDVPDSGGELMLWPTKQIKRENLKGYSTSRAFLDLTATPSTKIVPKAGMLVLFCAQKPHAIAGFKGEKRSSLQCFIGLEPNNHLALWN